MWRGGGGDVERTGEGLWSGEGRGCGVERGGLWSGEGRGCGVERAFSTPFVVASLNTVLRCECKLDV